MNWNPEELKQIIPSELIEKSIGFPIGLEVFLDCEVKRIDLQFYNQLIIVYANRQGNHKKLKRFYNSHFEKSSFDRLVGVSFVPQFLIQDSYNSGQLINFHVGVLSDEELFLNDLLLANVFEKPKRELLPTQNYPGMGCGVFDGTIENLASFAKKQGYSLISGHLAHMSLYEIFNKRGFEFNKEDPMWGIGDSEAQVPVIKRI